MKTEQPTTPQPQKEPQPATQLQNEPRDKPQDKLQNEPQNEPQSQLADPPQETQPPSPEPPQGTTLTPEDIETLVSRAEQRGYLRGRNEAIAIEMQRPALLEDTAVTRQSAHEDPLRQPMILSSIRPSIWDK